MRSRGFYFWLGLKPWLVKDVLPVVVKTLKVLVAVIFITPFYLQAAYSFIGHFDSWIGDTTWFFNSSPEKVFASAVWFFPVAAFLALVLWGLWIWLRLPDQIERIISHGRKRAYQRYESWQG